VVAPRTAKTVPIAWASPEVFIPRRVVNPRSDQLPMRCGKCGKREFRVHVLSLSGQVQDLICCECLTVYNLDSDARVAGTQER